MHIPVFDSCWDDFESIGHHLQYSEDSQWLSLKNWPALGRPGSVLGFISGLGRFREGTAVTSILAGESRTVEEPGVELHTGPTDSYSLGLEPHGTSTG